MKKITEQEFEAHFWAKCKHVGECWEWQGAMQTTGYGVVKRNGVTTTAHRLSYELAKGAIAEGLYVCHQCDNRKCINPNHLFLGSPTDNMQDKTSKGRHHQQQKTHCPKGHEYTADNTYINKEGKRYCRQCRAAAYHLKKAKSS